MKRMVTVTLALLLVMMSSAFALTDDQKNALTDQLPEEVKLSSEETEDGRLEVSFASMDGKREYEFTLATDGTVVKLAYDLREERGGATCVLTADQAKELVLKAYPEATVDDVRAETDDGFCVYDARFHTATISGKFTFDAESGEALEYTLYYGAPGQEDSAQAALLLEAAYPGAMVLSVEQEPNDDGVMVLEGKAQYEGRAYEFEMEADTGRILEWKADD